MRVFVTGASGWIGSALVPELLSNGHQVLGLARSDASAEALTAAGAEVLRGSLSTTSIPCAPAARDSDGTVHLAYIHDFSQFEENARIDLRAIDAMGEELAGSDRPFVIASGTLGLAPGASGDRDRPAGHDHGDGRPRDLCRAHARARRPRRAVRHRAARADRARRGRSRVHGRPRRDRPRQGGLRLRGRRRAAVAGRAPSRRRRSLPPRAGARARGLRAPRDGGRWGRHPHDRGDHRTAPRGADRVRRPRGRGGPLRLARERAGHRLAGVQCADAGALRVDADASGAARGPRGGALLPRDERERGAALIVERCTPGPRGRSGKYVQQLDREQDRREHAEDQRDHCGGEAAVPDHPGVE